MKKITNPHHKEILELIVGLSGEPTAHTFSDGYLGTTHPRYAINAPTMRQIAKEWMRDHKHLSSSDIQKMCTSLIKGESATEKLMVGILLDATTKAQRKFNPEIFDTWLDQLEGWAEIDSTCTGQYTITEIPQQWNTWKKLLIEFSKSKNISKRRGSLVLLCSPVRKVYNEDIAKIAFANINKLKSEKEILITKAISWLLRSMVRFYKTEVSRFLDQNEKSLPKIAVRETRKVLLMGKKTSK